jgi:hypothetical protein
LIQCWQADFVPAGGRTFLGEGLKAKSKALNDNVPSMTKLIFENMFAIIRQQQDFISKAMLLLNSQE